MPRKAGEYDVALTATDLAGNVGTAEGTIDVLKPKKRSAPVEAADDPLHGQGRRRQDVGRRRHGTPLRRRGAADDRALDRPGALAGGVAGGAASAREPTDVGDGLWAQQVQAQDELERNWSAVQGWLGGLLVERGVDRIAAEELTVPPGGDELFSLLQIKRHVE